MFLKKYFILINRSLKCEKFNIITNKISSYVSIWFKKNNDEFEILFLIFIIFIRINI
jgi:hypothetical protein